MPVYPDNSGEKMEVPEEFDDSPQPKPFTINVSKAVEASPVPNLNLSQLSKIGISPMQMIQLKPST
jgi:hypothetical protein